MAQSNLVVLLLVSLTVVPTTISVLVINELNADNPGRDNAEFVELFDGGGGNTSLDDYQLVFFNGNLKNDTSYLVIDLAQRTTNGQGYFVIGTASVSPPADLLQNSNFLQNGADAVTLYNKSTSSWTKNSSPSRDGLVDAIVYGSSSFSVDRDLVNALLPGQSQLHENADHLDGEDESLSRCQCCQTLNSSLFRLARLTPGAPNNCTLIPPVTFTPEANYTACKSEILINEINSDSPGFDDAEFIELYDGGRGNVDLIGHVLVLFNGNGDYSYLTVPLTGYKTDGNGYFLLGSATLDPDIVLPGNTVQNGPDGIVVYVDSPLSYPRGSPPTSHRIADAVVYGTRDDHDFSLIGILQQTNHQVNEDFSHHLGEGSISRCWSRAQVHPESFVLTHPTPRQANNCTGYPTPIPSTPLVTRTCQVVGRQSLLDTSAGFLISEVKTNRRSCNGKEFVELYDGGRGSSSLKGYMLYIVGGKTAKVICVDLSAYRTSPSGYFLIGTSSVKPPPAVLLDDLSLDIDSGAVALYANQDRCRSFLSVQNLVDSVVFGHGPKINTFLGILAPADNSIMYNPSSGYSISRSEGNTPLDFLSFSLQLPTPGESNLPCHCRCKRRAQPEEAFEHRKKIDEI